MNENLTFLKKNLFSSEKLKHIKIEFFLSTTIICFSEN